ncbi:hypothetical protein FsymDg_0556 [Candidatus Protofrankia datiscae]|uniref:Uncharacterized protein n=1 Tax=Candidatus Protofrankia datiscae TaxID=2716812 RepID=F8B6B5_9ACTN|nr:hypothetical protein FsymDg_0556 [Candidatus Protofrankia datiscae]
MSRKPTRKETRQTLRAAALFGAVLAALLAYLGVLLALPIYIIVYLTARLFAWPTICEAFRTQSTETCKKEVTGKITGCGHHRDDKRRDLWTALRPRQPASPPQAVLRLVRGQSHTPSAPPTLSAPVRVTFRNALSIYLIGLCTASAAADIAILALVG